jgi:hypothetical protein
MSSFYTKNDGTNHEKKISKWGKPGDLISSKFKTRPLFFCSMDNHPSALDMLLTACDTVTSRPHTPPPREVHPILGTPPGDKIRPEQCQRLVYSITSKKLVTMVVNMPPTPPRATKVRGTGPNGEKIIRKKYTCSHGPMRRRTECKNCSKPNWRLVCMDSYNLMYTNSDCVKANEVFASNTLLKELEAYKGDGK